MGGAGRWDERCRAVVRGAEAGGGDRTGSTSKGVPAAGSAH